MKHATALFILLASLASTFARDEIPIRVAITTSAKEVSYWITDRPIAREPLRQYLADCFTRFGPDRVLLVPDSSTTFDTVTDLVTTLRAIGYTRCAVIANQRRVIDSISATRLEFDAARIESVEWAGPSNAPK